MKKSISIICYILFLTTCLSAQKKEIYTVTAGTKVQDCIPFQEMYRYPEFTDGNVFFKNGAHSGSQLNFNFLLGEMQYIQSKDTLSIANEKDISLVTVAGDTFYFDNGYVELISGGQIKVGIKQFFELRETVKKDSYGSAGSGSATDSYSTLQTPGKNYNLVINQDRIFEKTSKYYLATPTSGFVFFNKKQVMQLFPQKKDVIQNYLKSNKVDFNSKNDLLRFADFLRTL
jgi:hypothetical protein